MFAVACSLPASTAVYSISPALRLDGKAPSMPDRRAQRRVLLNLGAAMLVSPTAARAFDLPLLDISLTAAMIPYTLEDAEARRRYAAKANPPLPRQQACVNYAVTTGDIESLQAMAEGGWSLADLVDDGGKTPLHRAAQQGNEAAIRLATPSHRPPPSPPPHAPPPRPLSPILRLSVEGCWSRRAAQSTRTRSSERHRCTWRCGMRRRLILRCSTDG